MSVLSPFAPSTPHPAPVVCSGARKQRGGERAPSGRREAEAEKGLEHNRERHIRGSAESRSPEPRKASKAQGRPCVCLAADDRARVLIPSRPGLLGLPL